MSERHEALALAAILHENSTRYQTTTVLVNAIITVGNLITSGGQSKSDALMKSLDALREMLIPGEKERAAEKMRATRVILEREASSGPMRIKLMSNGKKGKKKGSMQNA
jgi:hypothetical protein